MKKVIAKNTLGFQCSASYSHLRTPPDIWQRANIMLAERNLAFTVDVCASNNNHLVARYYTLDTDGLRQDWTGEIVWCHPMFDTFIGKWVEKAYHSRALTVLLLPAATHTRYFHRYIYHNPNAEFIFLEKPTRGFHFGGDNGEIDDPKAIGYIKPLMLVTIDNLLLLNKD